MSNEPLIVEEQSDDDFLAELERKAALSLPKKKGKPASKPMASPMVAKATHIAKPVALGCVPNTTFYRGMNNPFVLSEYNKRIVDHALDTEPNKHLIILARAGTGKTSQIYLLVQYLKPRAYGDIAVFAFNKHIVRDAKEVLAAYPVVHVSTIHAFGLSVLHQHFRGLQSNFKKYENKLRSQLVLDQFKELIQYEERLLALFDLVRLNAEQPKVNVLQKLADHHSIRMTPKGQKETIDWELASKLLTELIEWGIRFEENPTFDFVDMIHGPVARNLRPRKQFATVMVDEFQDTNPCQRKMALKALKWGGRFIAAGDDRQAIYGFAGASVDSLGQIRRYLKAEVLSLPVCFRCAKKFVRRATEFVPDILPGDNAIEGEEGDLTEEQALEKVRPGDLVICRVNAPLVPFAIRLIKKGIPAKVRGTDLQKKISDAFEAISRAEGFSWESFDSFCQDHFQAKIDKLLEEQVAEAADLTDQCNTLIAVRSVIEANGFHDFLKKFNDLFAESAKGVVNLSSIHRAKGSQADRVFVINYQDMPMSNPMMKDWQHDQELNLKYIACTRAKKELWFVTIPVVERQEKQPKQDEKKKKSFEQLSSELDAILAE